MDGSGELHSNQFTFSPGPTQEQQQHHYDLYNQRGAHYVALLMLLSSRRRTLLPNTLVMYVFIPQRNMLVTVF